MDKKIQSEGVNFTYSAKEQEELKSIRQKYLPPEEDKLLKIRKLDAHVTDKAAALSIIMGVIGVLVLGIGMCCCLVWQGVWFIPGAVAGVAGMSAAGMAYPVYRNLVKKERQRIAPEILRLTEEMMK